MKIVFFKQNKILNSTILTNIVIALVVCLVGLVAFVSPAISVAYMKSGEAIYQGSPDNKYVSLMINVYWGTEYVEPMLKILKDNDAQATFFVGGTWVAQNNDVFRLICDSNNEIASHGYHHKDHAKISKQANIDEISNTHTLVKSISGIDMNLFAPPSGSYNKTTLEVAKSLGYKTIMWSKDTIDWRDKNTKLIYNRATTNLSNGDLILMHPTKNTLEAFDMIVKEIKKQGYELVTVSQNIKDL